ncbi:hypothetical protein CPB84DRAFT_1761429 [Gymnopilus junonius]|uniref:Transmembrane protein n=1 Tax=Gymnopilus junonius TaxID=109634 RepID=A0A9P5TTC2_GYMJU|nr:hypothetical protein CPB84DRAFT_1761429 [Gymnopilus junonius]
MSRSVLVDDSDSGIQYIGSWFADTGIKSDGSFSYNFQGTKVTITGTVQFPAPSGSNSSNPSWVCTVDGNTIPSHIYNIVENRLDLCDTDSLSDGTHNITVQATSANQQTFWFDYIQYIPSVTVNLANSDLSIPAADSQINYGPGWEAHSPGQITSQTGSTASFNFTGTSLTWVGFYDNSLSLSPTTATYSIDDQNPIPFNLNGVAAQASGIQYNQILFQTPQLPAGNHTIQVVYQGNNQTAPFSYLFSSGSPNTTPTSSGGATLAPSALPEPTTSGSLQTGASNSSSSPTSKSSNKRAIVGGVVGGLALLIALFIAFLFLRARRKGSKVRNSCATMNPFYPGPNLNPNVMSQPAISSRGVILDPFLSHPSPIPSGGRLPSSTFASPTHTSSPNSYNGYVTPTASDPSNYAASQGLTSPGGLSVRPVYASPLPVNSKAHEAAMNRNSYVVAGDINHHPAPSSDLNPFVYPQVVPLRNEDHVRPPPLTPPSSAGLEAAHADASHDPDAPADLNLNPPYLSMTVRDQDSGLRFPPQRVENGEMVEVLPPDYTPA